MHLLRKHQINPRRIHYLRVLWGNRVRDDATRVCFKKQNRQAKIPLQKNKPLDWMVESVTSERNNLHSTVNLRRFAGGNTKTSSWIRPSNHVQKNQAFSQKITIQLVLWTHPLHNQYLNRLLGHQSHQTPRRRNKKKIQANSRAVSKILSSRQTKFPVLFVHFVEIFQNDENNVVLIVFFAFEEQIKIITTRYYLATNLPWIGMDFYFLDLNYQKHNTFLIWT